MHKVYGVLLLVLAMSATSCIGGDGRAEMLDNQYEFMTSSSYKFWDKDCIGSLIDEINDDDMKVIQFALDNQELVNSLGKQAEDELQPATLALFEQMWDDCMDRGAQIQAEMDKARAAGTVNMECLTIELNAAAAEPTLDDFGRSVVRAQRFCRS